MMLLYGSEGNGPKIQVLVQDETIWLSQKQMAELFEVSTATINEHLKNIFRWNLQIQPFSQKGG